MSDKGSRDELKGRASDAKSAPAIARLCYVDDSRTSAYVVRKLLQPLGYQVDYFQSAEPAFVALIQEDYDLLLTDLKVSAKGMDGDDLIRTLRQSGHKKISSMPVIVITGASEPGTLVQVYDAGANQVMSKPVDATELDGHIRRLLSAGKPDLRVVEQQSDRDNVVSLSTASQKTKTEFKPVDKSKENAPNIPVLDTATQSNQDTPDSILNQPEKKNDLGQETEESKVESKKESLLERAVIKQDQLKQDQLNEEALKNASLNKVNEQPVSEEEITSDAAAPVNDEDKGDNQIDSSGFPIKDKNILHEMDKHELIIRERNGLFGDTNFIGMFKSFVELVGARKLAQRVITAGLALIVVIVAWNLLFDQGQPVDTAVVESGEIFQSITVPGRVLSKQRVNISAAHTGRTVEILVKEGDRVKAGQVLAKMDDRELVSRLNRAKANLADAKEGAALAKRTLSRLRKAYKKGAVARRFVEDAEVDLSSARSRAGVAEEETRSAELELSKRQIKAPFSGTITAKFAEIGQWASPSESLFTLVDETQREIEVRVDSADSVAIDVGQIVAVSSDAFPGLEWHESVTRLGTAANNGNNSNSVKVYISLGNDAPTLRFGQQVDAEIRTAWNPNTLKVPFEALLNRDGKTLVAVISGGRVKLKPVETGIEDFSMVEIKQGLNDGELVVLSKGQFLQNGDKVHAIRGNP